MNMKYKYEVKQEVVTIPQGQTEIDFSIVGANKAKVRIIQADGECEVQPVNGNTCKLVATDTNGRVATVVVVESVVE